LFIFPSVRILFLQFKYDIIVKLNRIKPSKNPIEFTEK